MAAFIRRGASLGASDASWYPVRENPPRRGDLILMVLPETDRAGWTRVADTHWVWRYAYGYETGFPGPAAWFSALVVDGNTTHP